MSDTLKTPPGPDSMKGNMREDDERERRRAAAFWWKVGAGFLIAAVAVFGTVYYYRYLGKRAAAKQKLENAYAFHIDGKDFHSKSASFDFIIFTNDYSWVKGSASAVEAGGQAVTEGEVVGRVITPQMQQSFARSPDLIAVGLASSEGERAREEERANQRAQTAAAWLEKLANPQTRIWKLTLGQYDRKCSDQQDSDTSFERPLILVAVRSKDPDTNLAEALANAISGLSNLPDRNCYSRFDLSKVR